MKKIMLSLGLMLGALTLTNCSNEIDENINTNTDGVAFELTAAIEANRVETDSYSTAWAAGDAINLHYAVAGETTYTDNDKFVITEEDLANGRFTGTLSVALTAGTSYDWFAFYPYSSYITNPTGSSYYRLWQQTQSVLCDDMSHLTSDASGNWSNAPLYGVATAVEAGEPVAITMKQLGTMLRFNIGNSSSEDIVVKSVKFATTSQKLTGSYKVNYTDETPVVTMSGDTYTYTDVTLNVQDELLIEAGTEPGDASQIFAAVAPFTAPAGEVLTITVTTDKGVYETTKTLSAATEFKAGVVNTINVTVEVVAEIIKEFPYTETFADNLGDFTIDDVAVGSLSTIWKYDSYGYMKGSGYNAGAATEGWLISPYVDLTGAANPVLRFDHAGNYFGSQANMINAVSVYVREADGEWAALTIPVYPNGTSWTFVNSDDIALSAYVGKTVQFGFKYTSPASGSVGTWEVKNVNVIEAPFAMSVSDTSVALENTASEGTIEVTTKNADGYTITAALKEASEWLSVSQSGNVITYSATANSGNERIATIVVTATNGTETQTIDIIVTQAKGELVAVDEETAVLEMNKIYSAATNLQSNMIWGDFNVAFTQNSSSNSNYNAGGHVRLYQSDLLTFGHKDGYAITKIVLYATGSSYVVNNGVNCVTADSGTLVHDTDNLIITWIGNSQTVTLTAAKQTRFTKIEITYNKSEQGTVDPIDQILVFTPIAATATVGSEFTEPTLSGAVTTVTYTSSNTAVATVDAATGEVTLVAAGETTITATAAAEGNYNAAETSYVLTVNPASSGEVEKPTTTPDPESLAIKAPEGVLASDNSSISWSGTWFTMTNYKGSTAIRTSDSDHYRVYVGSTLTFESTCGYNFKTIVITATGTTYANLTNAEITGATASVSGTTITLTCTAETVSIVWGKQARIKQVDVTYAD